MRDAMLSIQGSLSAMSKILLEKQSIHPERICRLLDSQEFHMG